MPLPISQGVPSLVFRREAYERADLSRAALDAQLGLTDQEFRVEGDLIVLGPVYDTEALAAVISELEASGLAFYDDFFEMTGNWPEWLSVLVRTVAPAQ
jgi:hypothetical protein